MRALALLRGSVPRILLPVLEIFRGSLLLRILLSILEIILGFCAAGSISAVSAAHTASVCSTKHYQIHPVHSEYEEYREPLCTVSIVPSTRSFPHEPCTYAQQTKCSHGSGSFGVNCFRGGGTLEVLRTVAAYSEASEANPIPANALYIPAVNSTRPHCCPPDLLLV